MYNTIKAIINTRASTTLFIIRLTVGIVILPHGLQKLFGIFGGGGFAGTIDAFGQWFGIPPLVTILVILAESVGSFCLIIGFLGRFMAASIGCVLLGAIFFVVGRWGFFMNWYSEQQRGEGYEFHLLALGMIIAIVIGGSGRWSIDRLMNR